MCIGKLTPPLSAMFSTDQIYFSNLGRGPPKDHLVPKYSQLGPVVFNNFKGIILTFFKMHLF